MPHILKTKLLRIYDHGEPLQPYMARHLTSRGFMLKNGLWVQSHVFEPQTLESKWLVPEPGRE